MQSEKPRGSGPVSGKCGDVSGDGMTAASGAKSGQDRKAPGEGYIVIARKWRPLSFDEVVGQEHVTRTLKNAITGGRVAHAYLFTGPRGVGKTTIARVLAKALNCAESPTVTPCGKCAPCTEIAQGTSMDVIEIDGASNRGIDEIRNLRESVRYAPVGGKKKVYVIDEVHMLTTEAFNALLKTLEEPPPHVVFVFATTQPLKVPQTIVSRCQRFDFRRITTTDIADRLAAICKGDGYACEAGALAMIAQQAEGSMRDAQSMLEQVLAFSGGTASVADIRPVMGLRGSELVSNIGKAIVTGNEKQVLELLGQAFDAGVDPADLAATLIEWIRYLLISSIDPGSRELQSLTAEMRQELAGEARLLSSEQLLCILGMLTHAEDGLKRASHQRYLLESVILRMTRIKAVAKVADLIRMLEGQGEATGTGQAGSAGKGELGSVGSRGAGGERGAGGPSPGSEARNRAGTVGQSGLGVAGAARAGQAGARAAETQGVGRVMGDGRGPSGAAPVPQAGKSDVVRAWSEVVESLRETKASLASILDLCEPPAFSDGAFWLMLPSAFHQSQVMKSENLRILTQKIGELTNRSVILRTKIADGKSDGKEVGGRRALEDAAQYDAIAEKNPIVRALIENLGGKIVDIRRDRQNGPGSERAS